MGAPRNRNERRAAAAAEPGSSSIPLVHPSEDPRSRGSHPNKKTQTLYDVIAERQGELSSQIEEKSKRQCRTAGGGTSKKTSPLKSQFVTVDESGNIVPVDGSVDDGRGDIEASKLDAHSGASGHTKDNGGNNDDDDGSLMPMFDTLLQSVTLASLHCTLGILAAQQYAQEIPIKRLLRESILVAFPLLTLLVHIAHGHVIAFGNGPRGGKAMKGQQDDAGPLFPLTRDKLSISLLRRLVLPRFLQIGAFLVAAVFLGNKLITMTNEDGYYAVMKRAPSIGTLWVWSILELPLSAAVVGAVAPLGWGLFWKGYTIF